MAKDGESASRAQHVAHIESRARRLRMIAWSPRPDSDWDVPGKIHEDNKRAWRSVARRQLSTERREERRAQQESETSR